MSADVTMQDSATDDKSEQMIVSVKNGIKDGKALGDLPFMGTKDQTVSY